MPEIAKPGFPTSPRSRLWEATVAAIRTDPVLNSRVKLWQIWDGSEASQIAPEAEDLPYLRLDVLDTGAAWLDESSHSYAMPIRITIGVEGTRLTDLFDFWHAIHTALFTGNTVLNALIPLGLFQKTFGSIASRPAVFGGDVGMEGSGLLTLKARLDA